jgi:hypothetical protein
LLSHLADADLIPSKHFKPMVELFLGGDVAIKLEAYRKDLGYMDFKIEKLTNSIWCFSPLKKLNI